MQTRSARKRQPSAGKMFIKVIAALLLLLTVIGSGYAGAVFIKTQETLAKTQINIPGSSASSKYDDVPSESFLILGTDETKASKSRNEPARSDVMIVGVLNKKTEQLVLTSIPRDSLVNIDYSKYDVPYGKTGVEQDKITHAHYFGSMDPSSSYNGIKLARETTENLLGIEINHVVKVNFQGFVQLIDALNGVDVDVRYAFKEQDSARKAGTITVEKGMQHLTGEQALAYVRNRHDDPLGDIGRGQKQMQVIQAVAKEAASFRSLGAYRDILDAVGDNVETNLGPNDYLRLVDFTTALRNTTEYQLAGEGYIGISGKWEYHLDPDQLDRVKANLTKAMQGQEVSPIKDETETPGQTDSTTVEEPVQ
ncbi:MULTISPECIES: LCP family protein [Exiguobacterium]|uniref:LCP family protein n=1 Tax=Exiguobacterium antarcticum TaxID=132920 RepID=A0ABT6R1Y4_9BACL|nr:MULTISPECIES: LCP family protein [Exiguobacterium]MCT4779530.1 LCP family protein [Exiguobacterium soli]MDI3234949.1 LCP family protein [Exiguobacterium antarcticum]